MANKRVRYSETDIKNMHQHYPTASWEEIEAIIPGHTRDSLKTFAVHLGLRRHPKVWAKGIPWLDSAVGHLTELERSYLAGIIDGEGCITMNRVVWSGQSEEHFAPYVSIANTSQALMNWLQDRLPGLGKVWTDIRNTVTHPHHKTMFIWTVKGNHNIILFAKEIAPYLIIKRTQAEALVEAFSEPLDRNKRSNIYWTIKGLKKTA